MSEARPRLAVCMATYNGARFLAPQIDSILEQLEAGDELIVVDDGSTDETWQALQHTTKVSPCRVELLRNADNMGHVRTFERAVDASRNDVIVLVDQDDVWLPGYIERIRTVFAQDPAAGLIVSHPVFCDETLTPILAKNDRYRHPRLAGPLGVCAFLFNRAMPLGCTMSFRREELRYLLPFPSGLLAHDHWIFALATLRRRMKPLRDPAVLYRRHGGAVSTKRTPWKMVESRVVLIYQLARRFLRVAAADRRSGT